jgi:hypothetical protein
VTTTFVIAAAGSGSRFARAGFSDPKPAIVFQGKTLLWWSLVGVVTSLRSANIRVVLREESLPASLLLSTFALLELPPPEIVRLGGPTGGQADTVLTALDKKDDASPLVIWNVDTHLVPGSLGPLPQGNWLHLFPSQSPSMSFARVVDGRITKVAEKQVISSWASSGLYGFEDCRTFRHACQSLYETERPRQPEESYVAPLYQVLLDEGRPVLPVFAQAGQVVPLGTPEDLQAAARIGLPQASSNEA